MALYVCFDDSVHNPTYIDADSAFLIESDVEEGNPCGEGLTKVEVHVMPKYPEEIRLFADLMGWKIETDSDGQIILHTGVGKRLQHRLPIESRR